MNLAMAVGDQNYQSPAPTSGGGLLARARNAVIVIAGALPFQPTAAQEPMERPASVFSQTNSGNTTSPAVTAGSPIMEVRRLTGLTWEQLSSLLGVARRSLHFWASGKPLNAPNEERVGRLLACVRKIARLSARETRSMILAAQPDGILPFDLLCQGDYEEVISRLGPGDQSINRIYSGLSEEVRVMRRPPPPESRVGALQDDVIEHRRRKARPARSAKYKRKE
jgi:DNA-binding transcriptional regulator YiaG